MELHLEHTATSVNDQGKIFNTFGKTYVTRLTMNQSSTNYQSQSQVQAVFQPPVKDVANVYGRQQRSDYSATNAQMEASDQLRPQNFTRRFQNQYSGQLPYATTGFKPSAEQWTSLPTRASRVCINIAEEKEPFYERYWPITDHQPVQPSIGDVVADPRYHMQMTKTFTADYKKLVDNPAVTPVARVVPTYGISTYNVVPKNL